VFSAELQYWLNGNGWKAPAYTCRYSFSSIR